MGFFGSDARSSATNTTTLDLSFAPTINAISGFDNNTTSRNDTQQNPRTMSTSDASGSSSGSIPVSYLSGGGATANMAGDGQKGIDPLLAWMALNQGGGDAPMFLGDYAAGGGASLNLPGASLNISPWWFIGGGALLLLLLLMKR